VQRDVDLLGVTRKCLVDGVVDDFMRQVVWTRGVRVHARAATHGLETGKDFNIGCVVGHLFRKLPGGMRRHSPARGAEFSSVERACERPFPVNTGWNGNGDRSSEEFGAQPTPDGREHETEAESDCRDCPGHALDQLLVLRNREMRDGELDVGAAEHA
jgi:hypothetical protein